MDIQPTIEDINQLLQEVPLAAERLKVITLTRLLNEANANRCNCRNSGDCSTGCGGPPDGA